MPVDPRTGLFSSLLVPQESSLSLPESEKAEFAYRSADNEAWAKQQDGKAFSIQPASSVETAFRHGRWSEERERVRAALIAANVPAARVERFNACGANCIVEYSPTANKHRVRASYCHDRFCEPCAVARSKRVKEMLLEWTQGQTVRFLTLSSHPVGESLQANYTHIYDSFRKLRGTHVWKKSVRAGAALTEITRGDKGDHWHVHLHVLLVGTWIDLPALQKAWKKATGGATGCFLRVVSDATKDIGYTCKYASKGWNSHVVNDPDLLIECVLTLRGKRLLITFGDWYGREEQLCKAQCDDWKRVGRLDFIYADAVVGKPWAVAVFRSLCTAPGGTVDRPVFVGCDPPWRET